MRKKTLKKHDGFKIHHHELFLTLFKQAYVFLSCSGHCRKAPSLGMARPQDWLWGSLHGTPLHRESILPAKRESAAVHPSNHLPSSEPVPPNTSPCCRTPKPKHPNRTALPAPCNNPVDLLVEFPFQHPFPAISPADMAASVARILQARELTMPSGLDSRP